MRAAGPVGIMCHKVMCSTEMPLASCQKAALQALMLCHVHSSQVQNLEEIE
jgi:hypothetical protein